MATLIFIVSIVFYLQFQITSIYAGDSGELVSAAYTWGIAHPPGYPLFSLFGGILSHVLPWETVAWRVGLLSSIPMAFSLFFTFKIVKKITKNTVVSSLTTIFCAVLYPIWLYAVVPEVFGLYALFSLMIVYVLLLWYECPSLRRTYLLFFLVGLSLTHHHLIVLVFPLIGFIFYSKKKYIKKWCVSKKIVLFLLFFFLGFSVYVYAPIVSSHYPPFDWEHPATLSGFFEMLFRTTYGTFRASTTSGYSLLNRFLNVLTFLQYLWKDFGLIGCTFILLGINRAVIGKNTNSRFLLFYLVFLLFFLFYAGFPVGTDFSLGTLERFFIVPYFILAIFAGIGLSISINVLRNVLLFKNSIIQKTSIYLVLLIFCLPIITQFTQNYAFIAPLKNDKTIEYFAEDILRSVEPNGILSLDTDTSIFAVDYAYHVKKQRQDITYISFAMLADENYRIYVKRKFPKLKVPERHMHETAKEYVKRFILDNQNDFSIYYDGFHSEIGGNWLPNGLVYRNYKDLRAPELSGRKILDTNELLWQEFHNPLHGILGQYRHLLLSDIVSYYGKKRLLLAQMQLYEKEMDALTQSLEILYSYRLTNADMVRPFIDVLLEEKECKFVNLIFGHYGDKMTFSRSLHTTLLQYKDTCKDTGESLPNALRQFSVWDIPIE